MIECAAIKHLNKVYSLPKPNRHHNIIQFIFETNGYYEQNSVQGFLTTDGKFVDREEAMIIAKDNNQVKETIMLTKLFSEDLW